MITSSLSFIGRKPLSVHLTQAIAIFHLGLYHEFDVLGEPVADLVLLGLLDDVGHDLFCVDLHEAFGVRLSIEQATAEVEIGNDIDDVVEVVIGEFLLELYGQEVADKLDGLVVVKVVHEEFVVHNGIV